MATEITDARPDPWEMCECGHVRYRHDFNAGACCAASTQHAFGTAGFCKCRGFLSEVAAKDKCIAALEQRLRRVVNEWGQRNVDLLAEVAAQAERIKELEADEPHEAREAERDLRDWIDSCAAKARRIAVLEAEIKRLKRVVRIWVVCRLSDDGELPPPEVPLLVDSFWWTKEGAEERHLIAGPSGWGVQWVDLGEEEKADGN